MTADAESLQRVLDEASAIAARSGKPYCSAHLLLGLLAGENPARLLLVERGLDAAGIAAQLEASEPLEPEDVLNRILERCRRMARGCGSKQATTLHLVIALCTVRDSVAYRVLDDSGLDLANLRTIALALSTGGRFSAGGPGERGSADDNMPPRRGLYRGGGSAATTSAVPQTGRARRRELARRDPRVTQQAAEPAEQDVEQAEPDPRYVLDPETYPTLTALGRNLSAAAAGGQIEALVGRKQQVEQILDILGKRRANNPCLVGEPGVGKTAIVEGLAYLQHHTPEAVPLLDDRCLVELNMGALLSGTQLRGAFSERMAALRKEMETAEGRVVLFLDEIHTLIGAGAVGEGSIDAVSELSAAMARGRFPCVGATTTEHYRRFIEQAPAFQRRLQPILVPEPTMEETLAILHGIRPAYAEHHEVVYREDAVEAAARLAQRYITDRFLPDKAISLIDLAGSRAHRRAQQEVSRADVAQLVAESTEIPVDRLLMTDTSRFLQMESFMRDGIVGHEEIIERVCQVIRRNYAGFSSDRPIGSFLFLGPTGVGKTETVKVLADFLFQSRDALCRFDMSEFMEPHSVARLIGSPPGYVGHEEGGQLTEAVRKRPYQVLLLDEVEKAHRDVLQILLQLLDDGRLTDGRGRTVDFSNTVVVMTSNLGSDHYDRRKGPIGFGLAAARDDEDPEWPRIVEEVLKTARGAFPIELWNRIEERQVFRPLTRAQIRSVARLLVASSSKRLADERGITFTASDAALEYLIEHGGYDPALGARPMRTTIQRLIETPVAEQILASRARAGDELRIDLADGKLVVERRVEPDSEPRERGDHQRTEPSEPSST